MYLKYFCLSRTPFGITPDPAFLYLSPSHREALGSLLYGIEKRKGFVCLTGEVGCGKTTVLKALLARSDPDRVKIVYMFNPELSFEDLVRAIFEELGLEVPEGDLAGAVRRLHAYLIGLYEQGKHVVLIVDEAQRVPVDTLERLRILSNLETNTEKLLQIVLCGQPELDAVLAAPELRQLRQRIAVRAEIRLLTPGESLAYMQHRLKRVAYGASAVFDPAALKAVARQARGNPRRINIICDNALVAAYADQTKPVTAKIVREAVAGLEPAQRRRRPVRRWAAVACAAALLAAAGVAVNATLPRRQINTVNATSPSSQLTADGGQPASMPLLLQNETEPVDAAHTPPQLTAQADEVARKPVSQPPIMAQTPAPAPQPATETYLVKPGDTLTSLLMRAYGQAGEDLLEQTLKNNPQLRDPNRIQVGDSIVLAGAAPLRAGGSDQ